MENDHKELQLLPIPCTTPSCSRASPWPSDLTTSRSDDLQCPSDDGAELPSLDLQLSISLRPIRLPLAAETMKWGATDNVQTAAMESAYAERVMEMTKREIEMARLEFARARHMWESSRAEVERVEKLKEKATRQVDSCTEITCQACRRKFRP